MNRMTNLHDTPAKVRLCHGLNPLARIPRRLFHRGLRLPKSIDRLIFVRRPCTSSRYRTQRKTQRFDVPEPAPPRQPQEVFGQVRIGLDVGDIDREYS